MGMTGNEWWRDGDEWEGLVSMGRETGLNGE